MLHSEDVIASARWRDRVDAGSGGSGDSGISGGAGAAGGASALERVAVLPIRGRIARAVRAPVVAGVAVFVVAVLAAIGISVASSLGAQLPTGGGAAGQPELGVGLSGSAGQGNGRVDGSGVDAGASGSPGAGSASQGNASSAEGTKSANGTGGPLFVHVVGAVERAGVVELEAGARVSDAIEAAGGASENAVLAGVNLARLVVDGEQLLVPDEETLAAGGTAGTGGKVNAGAADASAAAAGAAAGAGEPLVNLNTADATLLETLPRVGPALAGRIIDWREQNGGFASVDQLLEVTGIGAKTLSGFRDRVTV